MVRYTGLLLLLTVSCAGGARTVSPSSQQVSTRGPEPAKVDPDPPASVAPLLALVDERPHDVVLIYSIARGYDGAGQPQEALRWLRRLDALGFDDALERADFPSASALADFAALAARFSARAVVRTPSRAAFAIAEPDLLAEGIAHDEKTGRFFISSGAKRKVLEVDRSGQVRDFIVPGTGGIYAVLGLEVDGMRRDLWAASAAAPFMADARPEDAGKAALFRFDVDTGALRSRHELPRVPALANDLAIAADGSVYVSDSIQGTVYRLAPGQATLEQVVAPETFLGPNGLAMAPDGRHLIVADFFGLSRVNPATGQITKLTPPQPGPHLGGIDGLVSAPGGLIGIQNLIGRGRVWRIFLGEDGQIRKTSLLEANHPDYENPTTGELCADGFYYLANPHFQGRGNGPLRPAAGKKLLVLHLPSP